MKSSLRLLPFNRLRLLGWLTALVFLPATLPGSDSAVAASTPPKPIRVLIVDGCSNHDWKLTTALIRGFLEPTGLFAVEVSTAPASATAPGWDAWRPKFRDYDA